MQASGVRAIPAALELEVELARRPNLYLMVDTGRMVVEVKARGVVLDRVPLRAASLLMPGPLLGGGDEPEVELPAIWRVAETPVDLERRVVAPESLEPYSEESAQAEPAQPTPTPSPSARVRHRRYGVLTDAGWRVELGPGIATPGFPARVVDGLRDVWMRVTGAGEPRPPVLALDVSPEDADRLHHLFRKGAALLVVPPPAGGAQLSTEGGRPSPGVDP